MAAERRAISREIVQKTEEEEAGPHMEATKEETQEERKVEAILQRAAEGSTTRGEGAAAEAWAAEEANQEREEETLKEALPDSRHEVIKRDNTLISQ